MDEKKQRTDQSQRCEPTKESHLTILSFEDNNNVWWYGFVGARNQTGKDVENGTSLLFGVSWKHLYILTLIISTHIQSILIGQILKQMANYKSQQ